MKISPKLKKAITFFGGLLVAGGILGNIKLMKKTKYPVFGPITSKFGNRLNPFTKVNEFHNGVDIGAPAGTPILSPWPGEVIEMYTNNLGGNQMKIKHTNGYITGYAHLQGYAPGIKIGKKFMSGHTVAYVGTTGMSTGPHLHFTLRDKAGNLIDPQIMFTML